MASSSAAQPNQASVSAQPLATDHSFKSDLIEFALKSKMKAPEFHSRNEGQSHAPKFRSSVIVDGLVFTTVHTFFHRKAADQEVSRIALEWLTNKVIPEGYSLVAKSVTFCKATLNEYAAKLRMKRPTYTTVEYKSVIPYFVCTVDFKGKSYTGEAAGRKRDAENLAARSAILSLIGKSDSGIMLIQIIKKKVELFDSAIPRTVEHLSDPVIVLDDCDKDIDVPKMPKQKPTPEDTNSTNEFQQPDAALPIDNVISAKKRRRNNNKASKRARLATAAAHAKKRRRNNNKASKRARLATAAAQW